MVRYKWIALSNTTIGVLMASINGTITLIALPAIFRGIDLSPTSPGSFVYLLWILMGFNIVTATLLVTFGRLSDMFGRVRLFNIGFIIFTVGSVLLFITPGKGDVGGMELIGFRIIQALGAAFLFSNSTAILTDAFPVAERGKAMGINQVAALSGSFIGLILGGVLAIFNWRYVFLVSVPVGILGAVWSNLKLRETSLRQAGQRIDYIGNTSLAVGLTVLLIGITYGLLPYGTSTMGWGNPLVVASIVAGIALIVAFPFIELKVKHPMFRMELFKNRAFSMGNLAALTSSLARGGVMIILIILLQGIWLPLHGYSYAVTPFWAGIYMVPMTAGFIVMGPLAGALSDKHGARVLSTLGMIVVAVAFLALTFLGYDFNYIPFAIALFVMGIGNGLFAAPNTASIMNSVPAHLRGVASGMRSTMQNAGMTASMGIFFTIVLFGLSKGLPTTLYPRLISAGIANSIASTLSVHFPPTVALFSAFLGVDPIRSVLQALGISISSLGPGFAIIDKPVWFATSIAPSFMSSLRIAFYIGLILSLSAAVLSIFRGKKYVSDEALYSSDENEISNTDLKSTVKDSNGSIGSYKQLWRENGGKK